MALTRDDVDVSCVPGRDHNRCVVRIGRGEWPPPPPRTHDHVNVVLAIAR